MPRDNLVGSSQTMTNRAALIDVNASLPTVIGSKDPYALKIPAREGGMLTNGELLLSISR